MICNYCFFFLRYPQQATGAADWPKHVSVLVSVLVKHDVFDLIDWKINLFKITNEIKLENSIFFFLLFWKSQYFLYQG